MIMMMLKSTNPTWHALYPYGNRMAKCATAQLRRLSSTTTNNSNNNCIPLEIYAPIRQALAANKPVVALESTILSHGMPYPDNINLATTLAAELRDRGVEPATVALRNGTCHVGLSVDELKDLAQARSEDRVIKCSSREIPLFLAKHSRQQHQDGNEKPQWGATTVASTMRIAHLAGISTFVTGGIGGVHRDGENSLDISADLTELGRTPVVVVSAGIKSILDIQRTLEVLETNAVPVVSYQTDEFPAFFSPHSGVSSPAVVENAETIARAFSVARDLGLCSGMLVAVPNQDPAGDSVEEAIQKALQESSDKRIAGQAVTPYILKRVAELTGGKSLKSNVGLVLQNAKVGAEIAIAISKQQQRTTAISKTLNNPMQSTAARSQVVVVGGIVVDIVAKPEGELIPRTSNPGTCHESDGGVGRNVAEVLGRLGARPLLYSAVANDSRGRSMLDRLETECGVVSVRDTVRVIENGRTATYLAVLDDQSDMFVACADMSILKQIPTPSDDVLRASALLVIDANPPVDALRDLCRRARGYGVEVFFEPTSVPKAIKIAQNYEIMSCLTHMSPNTDELLAMANLEGTRIRSEKEITRLLLEPGLVTIRDLTRMVLNRMDPQEAHIAVTLGDRGVLLMSRVEDEEPAVQHFPGHRNIVVRNATGAGDSFAGAVVHSLLKGNRMAAAVVTGMEAAVASLQCADRAISPTLSKWLESN